MKIKRCLYPSGFFGLQVLLLFASCSGSDPAVFPATEEGQEVALLFQLPSVEVRALEASPSVEQLAANTVFSVYAFRDNKNIGSGVYQVDGADATQASAVTIGGVEKALKLTKGKYDLYFFSYHAAGTGTGDYPELSGSSVSVRNGKDFLSTSLKGLEIQADHSAGTGGAKTFTVSMEEAPFRHLCARVKTTLELQQKPVAPKSVTGLSVKVRNLGGSGTYTPDHTDITTGARGDGNEISFVFPSSGGSGGYTPDFNASPVQNQYSSDDTFLLPVDASSPLKFDLSMNVGYISTQTGITGEKTQKVELDGYELSRQLQAGKSYNFVFRLTFYGDYKPVGVVLDIQEYTPVGLPADGVGED